MVAIDAGHGGEDRGAWFPQHDLIEKDINLDVARTLAYLLVGEGSYVVLTRTDDSFVELSERAARANRARAHILISIHVNRFPEDTRCCGAQVFFHPASTESKRLADCVQENLRAIDPQNKRLALTADFKVLREAEMTAILIEIGFATNARDRRLIMDPTYRSAVAEAIVKGLKCYCNSVKPDRKTASVLRV